MSVIPCENDTDCDSTVVTSNNLPTFTPSFPHVSELDGNDPSRYVGLRLLVLHDYKALQPDEISLKRGRTVEVLSVNSFMSGGEGWWIGRIGNKTGVFPSSFVDQSQPCLITSNQLTVQQLIGVGSYSKVYAGLYQNKKVAVKVFKSIFTDDVNAISHQVELEGRLIALLSHTNIISLRGIVLGGSDQSLVLEFCHGGSLLNAVRSHKLPPDIIFDWATQIASGMHYLHYRAPLLVTHRDLKSSNVLLSTPYTGSETEMTSSWSTPHRHSITLKICDFGLSRAGDMSRISYGAGHSASSSAHLTGSVPWMSPEVIVSGTHSRGSDVWSYGVLLWHMLTGQLPYSGMDPMSVMYGVACGRLGLHVSQNHCSSFWSSLMAGCWEREISHRLTFENIQNHLQNNNFNRLIRDITNKEDFFLSQRKWLLEMKCLESQNFSNRDHDWQYREEDVRQRELQLIAREQELLKREIFLYVQQSALDGPPRIKSRALKQNIVIGQPLDFRHKATVLETSHKLDICDVTGRDSTKLARYTHTDSNKNFSSNKAAYMTSSTSCDHILTQSVTSTHTVSAQGGVPRIVLSTARSQDNLSPSAIYDNIADISAHSSTTLANREGDDTLRRAAASSPLLSVESHSSPSPGVSAGRQLDMYGRLCSAIGNIGLLCSLPVIGHHLHSLNSFSVLLNNNKYGEMNFHSYVDLNDLSSNHESKFAVC